MGPAEIFLEEVSSELGLKEGIGAGCVREGKESSPGRGNGTGKL